MSTPLQDKVSFALDENRMLMLGSQVLVGFSCEVFFQRGFDALPAYNRELQVLNLLLILLSAVLLIAPTTYHRLVGADNDTERLLAFTTISVECALYPLAIALGLSLFCCAVTVAGLSFALGVAVSATLLALAAWGLWPHAAQDQGAKKKHRMHYTTPLDTRLRHVLTEARVMLPGAQALLGFQLITFYMQDFMQLPLSLQWIHLISLLFIATAVVMLIAPAAFHRIADGGEVTERSYDFANWMVLLAALPLGLGLAGELALVLAKALHSLFLGGLGGGLMLLVSYTLWFGYAGWVRVRQKARK